MALVLNKNQSRQIKEFVFKLLSTRYVYHVLFWTGLLLLFVSIEGFERGFAFTLSNELINLMFYAIIVYVNIFYLIPNYLSQKKFFSYFVFLLALAILITPIKLFVFHFKWEAFPQLQNILYVDQIRYYAMSFTAAGASSIIKIIADWLKHEREKQELETRNVQSELKFLKSQINPHFLFNTLNSIYALSLKKSDKAPEIVVKLSEMLRYMLYECNEKSVLLQKEISYIQNYLELEKLRHGEHMDIIFTFVQDPGNLRVAPLLFVPFLENAFKHGASNHLEAGHVHATLKIQNGLVLFSIENSKPESMPSSQHSLKSGGIGLVNIRKRLEILYPDRHALKIEESPDIYKVYLNLKIENQEAL